jgi:pimeloyl-ACP methyl ester carboxylesterase
MITFLVAVVSSLTVLFASHAVSADNPAWKLSDTSANLMESSLGSKDKGCIDQECTFHLYYFTGSNYARSPNRQFILFIPGGPGEIVDPRNSDLRALEKDFNVIYFDIRGAGNSQIPLSKVYDKYLRAEHVVADIDKLRQRLDIKSWDAIYAHSWGTIVAQLYGEESEKRERSGAEKIVKRLILSAPVARGSEITERHRSERLVANLREIYAQNSSSYISCNDQSQKLWAERQMAAAEQLKAAQKQDWGRFNELREQITQLEQAIVGDLCVVGPQFKEEILTTLANKLAKLEQYGSLNLVADHYDDPDVNLSNDSEFKKVFPYPKAFYEALEILQRYGSEETPRSELANPPRTLKTAAALSLSHYLTADSMICQPGAAPLFNKLDIDLQNLFCAQINFVNWNQSGDRELRISSRGRTVFGIYDGLSRWIFPVMSQANRLDKRLCFHGRDILDLAGGKLNAHKIFVVEGRKLAVQPSDEICAWQPRAHPHGVTSLILVGKADPVVAGGQPEEFFLQGLSGTRTLLRFPGVGHLMNLPEIKTQCPDSQDNMCVMSGDEARAKIVSSFVREPEGASSFIEKTLLSPQRNELYHILARYQIEISFVNRTISE